MLRRRQVQNKDVARTMRRFFSALSSRERKNPEQVAVQYAKHMWGNVSGELMGKKKLTRSRYYVGISADTVGFEDVTKRVVLVTDTLLLSGDWNGSFYRVSYAERLERPTAAAAVSFGLSEFQDAAAAASLLNEYDYRQRASYPTEITGFHSPDLAALGRWLLESEPLLKAGLAWYLPNYSKQAGQVVDGVEDMASYRRSEQVACIDYLIRDGRAVDASGAHPIKSRIVRPILEIELPFIDGVGLKDFSDITVSEFNSYADFRTFLRKALLELDDAVNAVQSEQALMRIAADIEQQLHGMKAQMTTVRRRRAVAVSGAGVGTVGAVLTAVYGPAMEEAFKLIAARVRLQTDLAQSRNDASVTAAS
ncbi:hypothetical protein ACWDCO_17755 [Streptomyces albogriseolus]